MPMRTTRKTLPCGCILALSERGRHVGFFKECETAIGIFATYATQPETREVSAARSADFDRHVTGQQDDL